MSSTSSMSSVSSMSSTSSASVSSASSASVSSASSASSASPKPLDLNLDLDALSSRDTAGFLFTPSETSLLQSYASGHRNEVPAANPDFTDMFD